jgi:hypothetical protein
MRIHRLTAAAATTLAALTIGLTATAADAATTYTPSGGPNVGFAGSNVTFTDPNAGLTFGCQIFDLNGSISGPGVSRAYGAAAVDFDNLSASNCTFSTLSPTGTWTFAITADASGTAWPADLAIGFAVTVNGCSFDVDDGVVSGTYDAQTFTPTASSLTITDVPSGVLCPILGVAQGDAILVSGSWTSTPPPGGAALTITNP